MGHNKAVKYSDLRALISLKSLFVLVTELPFLNEKF